MTFKKNEANFLYFASSFYLQRTVEYEEAQAYAEDNALLFMETSAKVDFLL